jgi:hypothetical protein
MWDRSRLARLARLLLRTHLRREALQVGSRDELVLALLEDEAAAEMRREIQGAEALGAPLEHAEDPTRAGADAAN